MTADTATRSAPVLDDQPSTVDLLNFGQFAAALREVILNPQTKTPFMIGIFGRWGTGKTTLMRMLERELQQRKVKTVWFSAWMYNQEEEIWAAFLQSLISRLAAHLRLVDQFRFSFRVFRSGFAADKLLYELPQLAAKALLVAIPVIAAGILRLAVTSPTGSALLQSGGIVTSAMLAVWCFLRPAVRAVRSAVAPDFSLYRSMDFASHVGFLDRFREQFERIVDALPEGRSKAVIFVDDLDRCSPEKALRVLDTIKVFLDVPSCVFVLGLDLAVIHDALASKYPNDAASQKEYLGKIIQLPFQLPPLTEADLEAYVRRLDVAFPDDRCREVFLASISRNPREIKRAINTFSLHWYLALERVSGNVVTPVRLAKVIVIQQAFAALFSLLRDQPQLLSVLERALRSRDAPAAAIPGRGDAGDSEATQVFSPTGLALPPALVPFMSEPVLARLLSMHADTQATDANFAELSADEVSVYFTLTRRVAPSAEPASATVVLADAPHEEAPRFGQYEVAGKLASGGMGQIYLAQDKRTGRRVDIKCLVGTLTTDPIWIARFEREMRVLVNLGPHPNIISILDTGTGTDANGRPLPFYVMEHVEGNTLDRILAREKRLDLASARLYLAPLFDGLTHLHKAGLVHRDLKPAHIIVTAVGTPMLTDFSLTFGSPDGLDELTSTGFVLGTPAYMSPEQARGEPVDGRSDLFSLGLIVFECLTGTNPAKADSVPETLTRIVSGDLPKPTAVAPDLSGSIDTFMARMLAPDPADRFPDAAEAKIAFERAVAPTGQVPV